MEPTCSITREASAFIPLVPEILANAHLPFPHGHRRSRERRMISTQKREPGTPLLVIHGTWYEAGDRNTRTSTSTSKPVHFLPEIVLARSWAVEWYSHFLGLKPTKLPTILLHL